MLKDHRKGNMIENIYTENLVKNNHSVGPFHQQSLVNRLYIMMVYCTTGQIKYTLTEIEQTHANLLHTHRDRTDSYPVTLLFLSDGVKLYAFVYICKKGNWGIK